MQCQVFQNFRTGVRNFRHSLSVVLRSECSTTFTHSRARAYVKLLCAHVMHVVMKSLQNFLFTMSPYVACGVVPAGLVRLAPRRCVCVALVRCLGVWLVGSTTAPWRSLSSPPGPVILDCLSRACRIRTQQSPTARAFYSGGSSFLLVSDSSSLLRPRLSL